MTKTLLLLALAWCGCAGAPHVVQEQPMNLSTPGPRAIAVVRIKAPWWAPGFLITRKFIETIPEYARAPGLEQKAYTLTDDGRFGGVYLWQSRAAAEAWFDARWHERVRRQRGVDADVRILDAPWTLEGSAPVEGTPLALHGVRTDAVVTWLSVPGPRSADEAQRGLRALATAHGLAPGIIRVSLVTEPDGAFGAIALWQSRAAANAFWGGDRRAHVSAGLDRPAELTWLDAPVLLDALAAKRDATTRPLSAVLVE